MSSKIDQLIKIAKSGDESSEKSELSGLNEAERFAIAFNLKPGRSMVISLIIYRIYAEWAGSRAVSKISFFKLFSQHFVPQTTSKRRFYRLNQTSLDMSARLKELTSRNDY